MSPHIEEHTKLHLNNKEYLLATVSISENSDGDTYLLYNPNNGQNKLIYILLPDISIPGKATKSNHPCELCDTDYSDHVAYSIRWTHPPRNTEHYICDSCKQSIENTAIKLQNKKSHKLFSHLL